MNQWHVLQMKRGDSASIEYSIINDAVAMVSNGIEPLPVYTNPDHLNEDVFIYFPPESYLLAKKYNASPCDSQDRDRLGAIIRV